MSTLYRLKKEAGGYLDVEIIQQSRQGCIEDFARFARERCAKSGGTWAEEEIAEVEANPDRYVEWLAPCIMVDFEPWFGEE